ncbi:putative 3-oxoadipate enol-lactone hydrolase/4-carboxymuconolactone decarboxylase [[Actinomadura] parvosata subsp. kistnae]|uniref:alpha/beta hydrolase n=1 Tax=[Actinomadura] parvosata TaxID=1955412 RepID=UPI000D29882D|nr:putative 3-oxoadipate enol-lactone hydrolase/4-carboxymuconolactone decarboxylase [Actinomadura parvosata subsp. kistnae]
MDRADARLSRIGHDAPRRRPLELDALADRLAAAATTAGHHRFSVVGYSLGVPVAVRTAIRHPGRVRSLVLTAGFAAPDPHLRLTLALWRHLAAQREHAALARLFLLLGTDPADLARHTPAQLDEEIARTAAAVNPGSSRRPSSPCAPTCPATCRTSTCPRW